MKRVTVVDPCWRCRSEVVWLKPNVRGSLVVLCAAGHCDAKTTSAKATEEAALKQWAMSSRRQRAKAKEEHDAGAR